MKIEKAMIWIHEHLTEQKKAELAALEPFMDYGHDPVLGIHSFQTFCAGMEIRDGKVQDIRKIKFYHLHEVRQGFICDDIDQAKSLCRLIRSHKIKVELLGEKNDYQRFKKYIAGIDRVSLEYVAVPVRIFCKYFAKFQPSTLDHLDLSLLKEWNINIFEYIDRKLF